LNVLVLSRDQLQSVCIGVINGRRFVKFRLCSLSIGTRNFMMGSAWIRFFDANEEQIRDCHDSDLQDVIGMDCGKGEGRCSLAGVGRNNNN
jgi:hypothetical protein